MSRYIETGRIVNTHGIRGEVKVEPWADSPDFLAALPRVLIDGRTYPVQAARVHKNHVLLALEGVDSIEAAMALRGRVISFDRDDAPLPSGRFYVQDIIGFAVYDTRLGRVLGSLHEVLTLPGGNVYTVRPASGADILIPARPEFLDGIDMEAKTVTVRTIAGMVDGDE